MDMDNGEVTDYGRRGGLGRGEQREKNGTTVIA